MSKLTQEYIEKLKQIPGETRGVVFETDISFLTRRTDKENIDRVKARLEELGEGMSYDRIMTMDFYPFWKRLLSLEIIRETLDLDDDDMLEMGKEAPRISLLIRMFARFFFSTEETIKQAPDMWEKHYTPGRMEAHVIDDTSVMISVLDLKATPSFWLYLEGYLKTIVEMVVNTDVHVTPKSLEDNKYEYICSWKKD